MCPFCIGAAAWAATGVLSAGGLGVLAAVVHRERSDVRDRPKANARSEEVDDRREF
jgi:hypothetical protein